MYLLLFGNNKLVFGLGAVLVKVICVPHKFVSDYRLGRRGVRVGGVGGDDYRNSVLRR